MMHQYLKETDIRNKESILGALSSFLRGDNFASKGEFLKDYNGLHFLVMILKDNKTHSLRLMKRVYFLLYDFIINDSAIFDNEDKSFVRRNLSEN